MESADRKDLLLGSFDRCNGCTVGWVLFIVSTVVYVRDLPPTKCWAHDVHENAGRIWCEKDPGFPICLRGDVEPPLPVCARRRETLPVLHT